MFGTVFYEIILLHLIGTSLQTNNHKHFTTQISEELPKGSRVIDIGKLSEEWFSVNSNNNQNTKHSSNFQFFNCEKTCSYFNIDHQSGMVSIERRIDRDNLCHIISTCCPKRNGQCHLDLTIKSDDDFTHIIVLVVDIKDINDNVPFWFQNELIIQFSEGSEIGDSKPLTIAIDNDVGKNGVSSYKMNPEIDLFELSYNVSPKGVVYSNREQLKLTLKRKLDREKKDKYEFTLLAFDGGTPSYNGSVKVQVFVSDENDNSPAFEKNTYTVSVNENLDVHSSVIQVRATDADSGVNGKVEYHMSSLTKPEYSRLFSIESNSGFIRVRSELDYETYTMISLIVEAYDMGSLPRGTTCTVLINIRDLNDNSPEIYFEPSRFTNNAKIIENDVAGKLVAVFSVQDKDSNENGKVTCHLDPIVNSEFALDRMNIPLTLMYKITTIKSFDREESSKVVAKIMCFDEGHPRKTTEDSVTVTVDDVNDETPQFGKKSYSLSVDEDMKPGSALFTVNATDKDDGPNAQITYSVFGRDASKISINPKDGTLYLESELDREAQNYLYFVIKAEDSGYPRLSSTVNVSLKVNDVNDNAPFIPKTIHFYILENHTYVHPIAQINATDADEGLNAEIVMTLISETAKTIIRGKPTTKENILYTDIIKITPESLFLLLPDGKLLIREPGLDRETAIKHELLIEATDRGKPSKSTRTKIIINVEDINDCRPKFIFPSRYNSTVKIHHGAVTGSSIAQIIAIDEDEGQNGKLHYSFKSNNPANELFLMHPESGRITLQQTIRETHKSVYILIVVVRDGGNPSLEDTARLQIVISPPNSDIKDPVIPKESSHFNKQQRVVTDDYDFRIQNNIIIIIALVFAAALFIVLISVATALLVCRKIKENQNIPEEGFRFKHRLLNLNFSVPKSFSKKRSETRFQEPLQSEPLSDQSLIQNNANNDIQTNSDFDSRPSNSYYINPLSLNYPSKTQKQDIPINFSSFTVKNNRDFRNEISFPEIDAYLSLQRQTKNDKLYSSTFTNDIGINNCLLSLNVNDGPRCVDQSMKPGVHIGLPYCGNTNV